MPKKTGAYKKLDKIGPAMLEAGKLDKDLAKAVGCSLSVVCVWRNKRRLPATAPKGSDDWRACHKSWFRKYDETITCIKMGMTDKEAAAFLGIRPNAFWQRRIRLGLKPGRYERVPKGKAGYKGRRVKNPTSKIV